MNSKYVFNEIHVTRFQKKFDSKSCFLSSLSHSNQFSTLLLKSNPPFWLEVFAAWSLVNMSETKPPLPSSKTSNFTTTFRNIKQLSNTLWASIPSLLLYSTFHSICFVRKNETKKKLSEKFLKSLKWKH